MKILFMNKSFYFLLSIHVFFISILFSSCSKTGCADTVANNFDSKAKKENGSCNYSYTTYIGNYQLIDTTIDWNEITTIKNYTLLISYNGIVNEIELQNLGNSWVSFKATLNGNNFIIPAERTLTEVEGTVNENKLRLSYSYNSLTCFGTGVKM